MRLAAPLVQEKIERFSEFPSFAGFLFGPAEVDAGALEGAADLLAAAAAIVETVEPWSVEAIETALRGLAEARGLKPRDAFQPIRLAVTGSKVSPGLFESIELLGREESAARLSAAGRRSRRARRPRRARGRRPRSARARARRPP